MVYHSENKMLYATYMSNKLENEHLMKSYAVIKNGDMNPQMAKTILKNDN